MRHDLRDGIGDRRRRIDDGELDAGAAQLFQRLTQLHEMDFGEVRRGRLARVPPMRETALRIGIDQRHRADVRLVRLDREMARQSRLARAALLRGHHENMHWSLSADDPAPTQNVCAIKAFTRYIALNRHGDICFSFSSKCRGSRVGTGRAMMTIVQSRFETWRAQSYPHQSYVRNALTLAIIGVIRFRGCRTPSPCWLAQSSSPPSCGRALLLLPRAVNWVARTSRAMTDFGLCLS